LQALELLAHVEPRSRFCHPVFDALEHGVDRFGVVLEALAHRGVTRSSGDGNAAALDQYLVPFDQVRHQCHSGPLRGDHADTRLQCRDFRRTHVEQQGQGDETGEGELVAEAQARHQGGGGPEETVHEGDS